MSTSCSFAQLSSYAVLVITGDWEKFLQGQLTCDLRSLHHHTSLGAHLTPQGKIRALFRLVPGPNPNSIYLSVPQNIATYALEELKKYAIFNKNLSLSLDPHLATYGFWNAPITLTLKEATHIAPLTHAVIAPDRSVAIGPPEALAAYSAPYQERPESEWLRAEIMAKTPWIFRNTAECFLPHAVQLVEQGGVSFDKGCYTGQEIVARMHYRGMTHKKTTAIAHCTTQVQPGDKIFTEAMPTEVGQVLMQAADLVLICLQTAALTNSLTTADHVPLSLLASEIKSHPE